MSFEFIGQAPKKGPQVPPSIGKTSSKQAPTQNDALLNMYQVKGKQAPAAP
jgi:hypothetical protein